jgi:uridine phosphorylase
MTIQPHILCGEGDVNPYVLLPGDPARAARIGSFLSDVREVAYNREFRTLNGFFAGIPITVTSTGIGGASTVIALEELIQCGCTTFIRTGSCGACQSRIGIGDLVISSAAVREDGASLMYLPREFPAAADAALLGIASAAAEQMDWVTHIGITRSHDSFYIDDEQQRMERWNRAGVLASDMETAALYVVASLRRVRALSILNNVVLYRGDVKEGIGAYSNADQGDAETGEKREIQLALRVLSLLHASREET